MAHRKTVTAILVAGSIFFAGCQGTSTPATPNPLAPVEIQQYQGKNLTDANSLPDNSIAGPQQVPVDAYRLKVDGLVDHPLSLTYDQVLALTHYTKVVTLHCVEGWDATILWEGVKIDDLLQQAGTNANAVTVIFHGADGYTTSLASDFIRENQILLAYKMNGITLTPARGYPFQVVAEEKWGYKWAMWVTEIELSSDANYRGYWEQRGYNQNGDLSGSMFSQ